MAPPLPSERNSFYAKQSVAGDGASARSGLLGHGRAESISGSIGGIASPLASPREVVEMLTEDDKCESAGAGVGADKEVERKLGDRN